MTITRKTLFGLLVWLLLLWWKCDAALFQTQVKTFRQTNTRPPKASKNGYMTWQSPKVLSRSFSSGKFETVFANQAQDFSLLTKATFWGAMKYFFHLDYRFFLGGNIQFLTHADDKTQITRTWEKSSFYNPSLFYTRKAEKKFCSGDKSRSFQIKPGRVRHTAPSAGLISGQCQALLFIWVVKRSQGLIIIIFGPFMENSREPQHTVHCWEEENHYEHHFH